MSTYEQLVLKSQEIGRASGEKLATLRMIWRATHRKAPLEEIADYAEMTPLLVKKWINWMQIMLQEDEKGSSAAIIASKINEAGDWKNFKDIYSKTSLKSL